MKVYKVEFAPMWPVGCALVILAKDLKEANKIAKKTILHTDRFECIEVDVTKSGVVVYVDGDY